MFCYLLLKLSMSIFADTEKVYIYYILFTISFFVILIIFPNINYEIVKRNSIFTFFFIRNILVIGWWRLLDTNFSKKCSVEYNNFSIVYKLLRICSLTFLILGIIPEIISLLEIYIPLEYLEGFSLETITMLILKIGGVLYGLIKLLVIISTFLMMRINEVLNTAE